MLAREVALEQIGVDRRRAPAASASELRASSARPPRARSRSRPPARPSSPRRTARASATSTAGSLERVEPAALERLHDHVARSLLVVAVDLRRRSAPRDGYRPVEVVRVRRAEAREARARPAPRRSRTASACARCRRPPGSAGRGRGASACRRTAAAPRRRPRRSEVDDDHRLGPQLVVRDAARLDREHACRAVDGARVAEGEDDEPGADELAVRLRARAPAALHGRPSRYRPSGQLGSRPGSSAARSSKSRRRVVRSSMTTSSMPAISREVGERLDCRAPA